MRSPQKTTIVFVVILLLSVLSFVSAELNKRDPQAPAPAPAPAPGDGKAAPAPAPAPGDGKAAPAPAPAPGDGKAAAPAPGDGKAAPAPDGKAPPPTDGKAAPAPVPGDGKAPPPTDGKAATPPPPVGGDGKTKNTTNINPQTPTVQVQILVPKAAKNILYKIGSNITFKWQYNTDFADPPESITAIAQLVDDPKFNIIIAQNMTLNTTQEVTWVTANESALPMAKYKLIICDERGTSAPPKPGGLQIFSNLQFGLYISKPGDSCPSCNLNSAVSISITSLSYIIGLTLITIISYNFILI